MTRLSTRLHGIAPTIFTQMSALAVRTQSVNLGQGFPDVDGPPEVIARAIAALETAATSTRPGPAYPSSARRSSRHQQRHYGIELDPDDQVVVTTGCTEAIAAALLGLVDPGDEVVVLEPYYDSYVAMIQMAGGVRRPVTLRAPDFRLDLDELRAAVTPATRFVLLNSPHNPTGTVLTPRGAAGRRRGGDRARPAWSSPTRSTSTSSTTSSTSRSRPCRGWPSARSTLSSAGKSYSFTGWKVGWATGPADLVGRRARRQAVADLHLGRPAAAGRRARPGRAAGLAGRAGPRPAGTPRPAVRRAGARSTGSTWSCRTGPTSSPTDVSGPRLGRRHGVLPGAARARRRRGDPEPGLPRRPAGTRPAPGPLGVLQDTRS